MANLEIGGRSFRDLDSYNLAKVYYQNIEKLKETLDMTDMSSVKSMLERINSGRIKFNSLLGDDFIEELEECYETLQKQGTLSDASTKKSPGKAKKANKTESVNKKSTKEYDELLEKEVIKAVKRNERRRKVVVLVLGIVAFGCIAYLCFYFYMYAKNDVQYSQLAELIDEKTPDNTKYTVNIVKEEAKQLPILAKYETLYNKNKKLVGWLKIDGTKIDYPVMQTSNNEYYLDHNYNQEYDKNGSIFMDKDCNPADPDDNMIIYGHHMKSGKMFGNLNMYASKDYFEEHPLISFDTIYEEGTYAIMYVFRSHIYSEEEIVFKYYKFINATSEDEFYSNMEEMDALSLYDTNVSAKYGDKLITLSTCDSSEANGRFVVVAKRIK